jgi:DNA polymerase elongation subunit (family B)|tara:strand:+ start:1565 stop:4051 length:2487 start_codon:yes stop_codon:yes gene_type:complete
MNFYKNVIEHKGRLLIRGVLNGKDYKDTINFGPTLYAPTKEHSQYKTLQGQYLKPLEFTSINAARRFRRDVATDNSPVYGLERYHYQYIGSEYPEDIKWEKEYIKIFTLDIETTCENGFPDVENPVEELLCITVKNQSNKSIITWGVGKFTTDRTDITYIECKNEKHLIMEFMKFWLKNYPDVITGWNTKFFDLPYLMNRIKFLVGDKVAQRMSPWSLIDKSEIVVRGRPQTYYKLLGICMLDYLDLYRWFIPTRQESYRLDFIGELELGHGKHPNPYETFKEFYEQDFQKFVDYNIQDVEIVDALEDKLGLIDLSLTVAYESKVNYDDIFSQVRVWDTLIANHLMKKNICVPPREEHQKDTKYEGAYVKDPALGMHDWIVSFDINSLYPHIIIQYNISPEKLIGTSPESVSVNKMLKKKVGLDFLKTEDACLTPNGAMFKRDSQGFLPEMMESMYKDRIVFKKRMLKAKKQYQKTKTPELKKEISRCNNIQWARKIALNSAYGAVGNQYFRYYDVRQAAGITTAGQFIIRFIERKVNDYLNSILNTEKTDYIVASDTDSIYVRFKDLVEHTCKGKSNEQILNFLDKVCENKLEPFIAECFDELGDYSNAFKNAMVMKREVIADKGIWVAKKRYMLNVLDDEGVRLAQPKLKLMGIEAVKSSTPQVCRVKIKEAIEVIMSKEQTDLHKLVAEFRKEFMKLPAEAIAFPRSCNNVKKYRDHSNIFIKGTPIHVKGALIYNYQIQKLGLKNKYPFIQEGDKIKFIKLVPANPFKFDVISYITSLPPEFKLQDYIDYETQFEKTFTDPMRFILDAIGWKSEPQANLEAFFG